jgi:hypothetical protein
MIDQKQMENVKYFNYCAACNKGSKAGNITFKIAMPKATFTRKNKITFPPANWT